MDSIFGKFIDSSFFTRESLYFVFISHAWRACLRTGREGYNTKKKNERRLMFFPRKRWFSSPLLTFEFVLTCGMFQPPLCTGDLPMSRVKWTAKGEHEFLVNYKILQRCFTDRRVDKVNERREEKERLATEKERDLRSTPYQSN